MLQFGFFATRRSVTFAVFCYNLSMVRPKADMNDLRTKRVAVSLTEHDYVIFRKFAESSNTSMSKLLAELLAELLPSFERANKLVQLASHEQKQSMKSIQRVKDAFDSGEPSFVNFLRSWKEINAGLDDVISESDWDVSELDNDKR